MSIRKILVPTDFSPAALSAAETAASIARHSGARIYFLHGVEIPSYADNYTMRSEYQDTAEGIHILKEVKKQFENLFGQEFLKDVNAAEVIQFDGSFKSITDQAEEHDIDLIVMGTNGTTAASLNDMFVGSNTERVVRTAKCPVLAVKSTVGKFRISNIVFASNFDEESTAAFLKVDEVLQFFDAKIHLVKINVPNNFQRSEESEERMKAFAKYHKLSNYTINVYNDLDVEDGIRNFSKRVNADMIVMTTHGRTGLAHVLRDSIAEGVVNHLETPVLTIKENGFPKEFRESLNEELAGMSLPENR